MEPSKPLWHSKTFWVNALTSLAGIFAALAANEQIKENPQLVGWIFTGIGIVNVFLRLFTDQPVTLTGDKGPRPLYSLILISLACLGMAAPRASAQEIRALDITSLRGTYFLTVTDAGVTVRKISLLQSGTTPTDPDDPVDPPPPAGTPFEKEISRITKTALDAGGTKTTGAGISAIYSLTADAVSSGQVPPDKALEAVRAGTNLVLSTAADKETWKTWRQSLSDALAALQQDGALKTKEQWTATLRSVSKGMNAVTGFTGDTRNPRAMAESGPGILDGIDISKIIELIKMFLELLKIFTGGAATTPAAPAPVR